MMGVCVSLPRKRQRGRGGVAVALVIALILLQLIVVGMVMAGAREQALRYHRAESLRAFYAADAALNMSLLELAVSTDLDADGVIGGISDDGSASTGPMLLGSRVSSELEAVDATSGEILAGANGTQAARTIRAQYSLPVAGGGGRGLAIECYALASTPATLASVNWNAAPTATGAVSHINFSSAASASNPFWTSGPASNFAVRVSGFIEIPQDGNWTFSIGSDAGSRLLIDGSQLIDHDGVHGYSTRTGSLALTAGRHPIEILYFDTAANNALTLAWQGPGVPALATIPPSAFALDDAPSPEFPPIVVSDFIYVWGDNSGQASHIDSFNASAGSYGGSNVLTDRLLVALNSTATQRIQMSGRAEIRGSVHIGPGGSPATVVALWGSSEITGGTTARSRIAAVHRTVDPYVTMPLSSGSQTYTSSFTIDSHRTFQDLSVWGTSTEVTIVGNVVIRCTGSFNIGDRVEVKLAAGATLTLFVAGDVNIYDRARLNHNTGDPARCWVFMSGTDQRFQMTDRTKCVVHVRNPRGAMELWGAQSPGSEFFGTFHGRSLAMGDRTQFHGDVSLLTAGSGGGGAPVSITSWSLEP
jgi:hypothetical protein